MFWLKSVSEYLQIFLEYIWNMCLLLLRCILCFLVYSWSEIVIFRSWMWLSKNVLRCPTGLDLGWHFSEGCIYALGLVLILPKAKKLYQYDDITTCMNCNSLCTAWINYGWNYGCNSGCTQARIARMVKMLLWWKLEVNARNWFQW